MWSAPRCRGAGFLRRQAACRDRAACPNHRRIASTAGTCLTGCDIDAAAYTLSLHDALPTRSEERRVGKECKKGVLANATAGNVLRLVPPLNIHYEDLEKVMEVLKISLDELNHA